MAKYPYASAHYDQALPLHLCCFLDILFMFIVLSCYINYDPVLASMFHNLNMILMVCPLLLVVDVGRLCCDLGGVEFLPITPLQEIH